MSLFTLQQILSYYLLPLFPGQIYPGDISVDESVISVEWFVTSEVYNSIITKIFLPEAVCKAGSNATAYLILLAPFVYESENEI
ncbi:hypothetical protein BK796_23500 [Kosakonia pseudosacchari]|uniref:Transposase n=1 Tax=Kosakonia pseudosacchari TaxID=1646340 RepID=A0ABX4IHY8_9ENTR|nr:hypothetical protein BK796_23500 [Kosakonia pseudosacchari]